MKAKLFTFALASLLLTGCTAQKEAFQNSIPKDVDAQARHFIELLRTGHHLEAELMVRPDQRNYQATQDMEKLHGLLDQGEPLEIVTTGYQATVFMPFKGDKSTATNLYYQIHFKNAWVAGTVLIDQKSDVFYVRGAYFYPISDSLEVLNRFTLAGKSPVHYAILVFSILIPAFILYALVVCIRSPIRRKWLWIVFILFSVTAFRLDWTTGLHDIRLLTVQLFGIGVTQASPYSPWIFELGLPVGALAFLVRRRKLMQQKPPVRRTVV